MAKNTVAATQFTVGWVCALPIELAAAAEMMDEEYADVAQPATDTNIYTCGRIGAHNVVAACLPAGQMGTNSAATVISQMWSSFTALRFGLLVGIGGGVPSDENDIRLGDVVISQPFGQHGGVVQYDFGKTGPSGCIRTGHLNAPPTTLLTALAKLRANDIRSKTAIPNHLSKCLSNPKFACPGPDQDTLYAALSPHVPGRTCVDCSLGDMVSRITRQSPGPSLFFGNIASGNQVIKDGASRDRISHQLGGVLCFEMEAAGLMNNFPCLVVRGICDYADAHKNKQWQPYAAAAAAASAKELLNIIPPITSLNVTGRNASVAESHFLVSIGRNEEFIGRETMLEQLLEKADPAASEDDCQMILIEGLGGVGKTQIALEIAYRTYKSNANCSVFWVPAVSTATFDNAFREIGRALEIPGIDDQCVDINSLVKAALSRSSNKWLLIIDNVDNLELLLGNDGPVQKYLPFNRHGSILFTTRNHEAAINLGVSKKNVFAIPAMSESEAIRMLHKSLEKHQIQDTQSTVDLLELLAHLPLAIKQASAYMNRTGISIPDYLELCRHSDKSQIHLLNQNFGDASRYRGSSNPIAATWLVSFHHMARSCPLAAQYLKFSSFLAEKDIPICLLPGDDKLEMVEAIGALKGYAFITTRQDPNSFDMHRLVRVATRSWVKDENAKFITLVTKRFNTVFPNLPTYRNRDHWIRYIPHVQVALEFFTECLDERATSILLTIVGIAYGVLGNYVEQESILRRAVQFGERAFSPSHECNLRSIDELAICLITRGRYDEAEKLHRFILEKYEHSGGRNVHNTVRIMQSLAANLANQGRLGEAEQIYKYTLDGKTKHYTSPSVLFFSFQSLGGILYKQGKYEQSEKMYREALELQSEAFGSDDPEVASTLGAIATSLMAQGKFQDAEHIRRDVLWWMEAKLGPNHPETVEQWAFLGFDLIRQSKYADAENIFKFVLEVQERIYGLEHTSTITTISGLFSVLYYQGKYKEGQLVSKKLQSLDISNVLDPSLILNSFEDIIDTQGRYGKGKNTEKSFERILRLKKDLIGLEHPDSIQCMFNLVLMLENAGKIIKAFRICRFALKLRGKALGLNHPAYLSSLQTRDRLRKTIQEKKRRKRLEERRIRESWLRKRRQEKMLHQCAFSRGVRKFPC